MHTKVSDGVPVHEPILFPLYMLPLGNIIRKHHVHFHCYAEDIQLYKSLKPGECNHLVQLQECQKNIKTWMTQNVSFLNSDETEIIVIGPKHLRETLSDQIVTLDGISLARSSTVRNLRVM